MRWRKPQDLLLLGVWGEFSNRKSWRIRDFSEGTEKVRCCRFRTAQSTISDTFRPIRAKLPLVAGYCRSTDLCSPRNEVDVRKEFRKTNQPKRAGSVDCSFCVSCDARRPDLVEAWYRIMRAVRLSQLRCRLKLLTWQELATVLQRIFNVSWL